MIYQIIIHLQMIFPICSAQSHYPLSLYFTAYTKDWDRDCVKDLICRREMKVN